MISECGRRCPIVDNFCVLHSEGYDMDNSINIQMIRKANRISDLSWEDVRILLRL
jgi:hypothetical protein